MSTIKRNRGRPDTRQPLPAGHPESWGLITRGTCLEGVPWPGPAAGSTPAGGGRAHGHRGRAGERNGD